MSFLASRPWPLKWYFLLNAAAPENLKEHARAAVRSAKRNTRLRPFLVYDGPPDELCDWMNGHGVQVVHAQVPFKEQIAAAGARGFPTALAAATYLRTMIPQVDLSDEIVLVTDCDVLFLRDPVYEGRPIRYFAAGPERDIQDYSHHGMSTAVTFMNLARLRACQDSFFDFLRHHIEVAGPRDRTAYRMYFNGLWEKLDPRFNWKPYWGISRDAAIVHFHGPKLDAVRRILAGERDVEHVGVMVHADEQAYRFYSRLAESFLSEDVPEPRRRPMGWVRRRSRAAR